MRASGLAAIVGGVAWAVSLSLGATAASEDPVGLGYDDYNRLLTLPLLLQLVALAGLRSLQRPRLSSWGRRGAGLALLGGALLLVGNVVEFWLVLFSDEAVVAIAADRGLEEWAGSTVGWLTFLTGALLLFVGGLVFASATWRAMILPGWAAVVVGSTAPLLLAALTVWATSVPLTAVFAGLLGFGWVAVGGLLLSALEAGAERPRAALRPPSIG
jgi:hypothetical protein